MGIPPPHTWDWEPGVDNLGCTYNLLNEYAVEITSGTSTGQVSIGLYANFYCNFRIGKLDITP
jgi:hypothetical protein